MLGGASAWPKLVPAYRAFARAVDVASRVELARSFGRVAATIGPDLARRDMLTIFDDLIVDSDRVCDCHLPSFHLLFSF